VTDTEGFLLEISVHQAGVNDKSGARLVLSKLKGQYPRLELLWGDKGYDSHPLEEWAEAELEAKLEIVKHPWDGQRKQWVDPDEKTEQIERPSGFVILPRRWVVERTFAWAENYRRLSKDYEYKAETSETMFRCAMIHLMARRLSRVRSETHQEQAYF
jgi:putative transposase